MPHHQNFAPGMDVYNFSTDGVEVCYKTPYWKHPDNIPLVADTLQLYLAKRHFATNVLLCKCAPVAGRPDGAAPFFFEAGPVLTPARQEPAEHRPNIPAHSLKAVTEEATS